MRISVHVCMGVCVYVHLYVYANVHEPVCVSIHTRVSECVCKNVLLSEAMCVGGALHSLSVCFLLNILRLNIIVSTWPDKCFLASMHSTDSHRELLPIH